jgi:hypothetical protein
MRDARRRFSFLSAARPPKNQKENPMKESNETRFRFTDRRIQTLPPNPPQARARERKYSDTEVTGMVDGGTATSRARQTNGAPAEPRQSPFDTKSGSFGDFEK